MEVNTLYVQTQGIYGHQPLIFFHAFPLSSEMWREQMNLFAKNHYVLAPDLPGFGKGNFSTHAITFEYYIDALHNFLKESGIKNSIWCGLSMGGYAALRLYEKAPELCGGLILANTKAAADDNGAKIKRWDAINNLHTDKENFFEKQWQAMIGSASKEDLKLKKSFFDMARKASPEGLASGLAAMATRTDTTTMLSQINVPTLIIRGEEDKIISMSDAEVLHKGIVKSKLQIIKGAGHLSNLENPKAFNLAVADFLGNVLYRREIIELL